MLAFEIFHLFTHTHTVFTYLLQQKSFRVLLFFLFILYTIFNSFLCESKNNRRTVSALLPDLYIFIYFYANILNIYREDEEEKVDLAMANRVKALIIIYEEDEEKNN